MASIWNRFKGESTTSSVTSTPKQPSAAPRFTGAQVDQMRAIVDALNLDIELYQNAEVVGDNVTTLWSLVNGKRLVKLDQQRIIDDATELVEAFSSLIRPIDTHLGRIRNKQPRLRPSCGPEVDLALAEFKRACDEARTNIDQLQLSCTRLQLGEAGDSPAMRGCWDRLQDLKNAINNMHANAPGLWRPLYNDISDLVTELKQLLPRRQAANE